MLGGVRAADLAWQWNRSCSRRSRHVRSDAASLFPNASRLAFDDPTSQGYVDWIDCMGIDSVSMIEVYVRESEILRSSGSSGSALLSVGLRKKSALGPLRLLFAPDSIVRNRDA